MDAHEFREVGHRTVDLLSDYLEHIEERPLFADVEPAKLNNLFAEPLPQNPTPSKFCRRYRKSCCHTVPTSDTPATSG